MLRARSGRYYCRACRKAGLKIILWCNCNTYLGATAKQTNLSLCYNLLVIKRVWDPTNQYKEGFVKEYDHWVLEVSFRQHTLGCFIIFAKRSVEKISELHDQEVIELKKVMKEFESTLSEMENFKPDRFNYLQLGNATHHLHFHIVPRYATPRKFLNREWIDESFGHPPIWSTKEVNKEVVLKIKDTYLANHL
jgi:diadenosine tetraphosphate (Ap4A) HIT family hydrolase